MLSLLCQHYPLFLLLSSDIAAYVGPGNVLWPPNWLATLFPPSRLPTACGILQHFWNERSELSLQGQTQSVQVISDHQRPLENINVCENEFDYNKALIFLFDAWLAADSLATHIASLRRLLNFNLEEKL